MGSAVARRLPRYVQGFVDRHGKARFYVRRKGFPKTPLPGLPWSPAFMTALGEALAVKLVVQISAGADKVKAHSVRALAISYYASLSFTALKPITQGVYRNIIDKFCREKDQDGKAYADKSAVALQREHIEKILVMRSIQPESANGLRKALRAMMKHAIAIGWRKDDPTQGVAKIKPRNRKGFHRWTEPEVTQFEQKFPVGTKQRLALALGLYTGQARQDVVRMGKQHIGTVVFDRGGEVGAIEVLNWTRVKTEDSTGLELAIPVHPELRRIIDATPSGHLGFLVTAFGKPFTAAGFGGWFRKQCNTAGLPHCAFHGLRKAAATRLADVGCDPIEIAAITGHATLKEVQRYTLERDRKLAAQRAMAKLISRTEVSNRGGRFDNQRKKR